MSVKVENTENKNEVKLSFVVEAEKFDACFFLNSCKPF